MERPDARAEKAQADGAGEFGNSISLFLYCCAGISPLRRRRGGFPIAPLDPFGAATFGVICGFVFVARGETSPMRSLYITNIIPKACVSGKQSTVLRKDEHSALFNQICYDFSAKNVKFS
jgi:hypothetical protein